MTTKAATVVVAAAGIGIASLVGYFIHRDAKDRSEARAVVSMAGETTAELKAGLKSVPPDALEKIEARLVATKRWRNAELADALQQYLIGAREILRRRAEANRLAQKAAASRAALADHMGRASGRDPSWIRTASQLKRQVERDHFDLDMQLGALATLLDSLPEANKRLAPHVQASLLLEDSLRRSAHQAVLNEAKRSQAQLAKTRDFLPR
jgi:hypothetical protein